MGPALDAPPTRRSSSSCQQGCEPGHGAFPGRVASMQRARAGFKAPRAAAAVVGPAGSVPLLTAQNLAPGWQGSTGVVPAGREGGVLWSRPALAVLCTCISGSQMVKIQQDWRPPGIEHSQGYSASQGQGSGPAWEPQPQASCRVGVLGGVSYLRGGTCTPAGCDPGQTLQGKAKVSSSPGERQLPQRPLTGWSQAGPVHPGAPKKGSPFSTP